MLDITKKISPVRGQTLSRVGRDTFIKAVVRISIACVYLFLVSTILANLLGIFQVNSSLFDFGSFIASGRAVRYNLPPYEPFYPSIFHVDSKWLKSSIASVNLNPPIFLPIAALAAAFNPYKAIVIWRLMSLLLYIACIGILYKIYPERLSRLLMIWSFALGGLWHLIEMGQVYVPLFLFEILAFWLLNTKRDGMAGVSIGLLVALKPNFLVWPMLLLLSGYWQTAGTALLAAFILSLVPIFLYGPAVYVQWLEASSLFNGLALPTNNSLTGLMARFNLPILGTGIAVLLILLVAQWAFRKRPGAVEVSEGAVILSLLASPVAWAGYTIFLLPMFYRNIWSKWLYTAAVILSVPYFYVIVFSHANNFSYVFFGWWYGWALILILVHWLISIRQPVANTSMINITPTLSIDDSEI